MTATGGAEVTFRVCFHAPFLVAGGSTGHGMDAVRRPDTVLPASSLKGAMRAGAAVLGVAEELICEVFGSAPGAEALSPSSWAWSDAGPEAAFLPWSRSRVRLDPATHTARSESLTAIEEYWQVPGQEITFTVESLVFLSPEKRGRHEAVLWASAYAVTALGLWRNRGMGAVSIRPEHGIESIEALLEVCDASV